MRPLLKFFFFTFAATWSAYAAAAVILDRTSIGYAEALFLPGTIAPSLVALALTSRVDGRAGVRALLARIFRWHVRARWYVFALAYMVAIKLTVALVHRVATGAWPPFGEEPWYLMGAAIFVSTWVQAGEEIGWRGYALPRLTARLGLARASVILGVIWAAWHLPLFFIPRADIFGQSFPVYLLGVTAVSVAMAWLYWRTGGSLFLVMLMHAAVNNTAGIVRSSTPATTNPLAVSGSLVAWLTVALLWLVAAYLLTRMSSMEARRALPASYAPRPGVSAM